MTTTEKYFNCCKTLAELGEFTSKQYLKVTENHQVTNSILYQLQKLGFVKRKEHGKYIFVKSVSMFDAETLRIRINNSINKKHDLGGLVKDPTRKIIKVKDNSPTWSEYQQMHDLNKKTFSLFWGLIKFNY